jgi:hypothetical protein
VLLVSLAVGKKRIPPELRRFRGPEAQHVDQTRPLRGGAGTPRLGLAVVHATPCHDLPNASSFNALSAANGGSFSVRGSGTPDSAADIGDLLTLHSAKHSLYQGCCPTEPMVT